MYKKRINELQHYLSTKGIDVVYLHSGINCFYFSGFTGSSREIILTPDKQYFYTDFRYGDQAHNQVTDYEISVVTPPVLHVVGERLKKLNGKKVGLEFSKLTAKDFIYLKELLPETTFVNVDTFINEMRMVKDEIEISYLKKGMEIVDKTYTHILSYLKTGISERDLALELE